MTKKERNKARKIIRSIRDDLLESQGRKDYSLSGFLKHISLVLGEKAEEIAKEKNKKELVESGL